MPKDKFPPLGGNGIYLQFALACQEQTKYFTNVHGVYEGDRSKLLQLIKEDMLTPEDKKTIGSMFNLDDALTYLNAHYMSDGNLANSSFVYLKGPN